MVQDLLLGVVDVPNANAIVVNRHELLASVVKEGDLVGDVHANSMANYWLSADSFPDYELVIILAAQRRQACFVVRERETLDQHLVHLQSMYHFQSVEVPHADIGLEALVGFLSTSNVLSGVGTNDDRNFVVVAPEELLCSADDVSDDDRGAQREYQMLIVRVQNESLVHLALESDNS